MHIYSSEKLPGAECHVESKAKALLTHAVFNPAKSNISNLSISSWQL